MDELLSSLLVWHDGQLTTASHASSLQVQANSNDSAHGRRVGESAGSRPSALVGTTTAPADCTSNFAPQPFRRRDVRARNTIFERRPPSKRHVDRPRSRSSATAASSAHTALQAKLANSQSKAARSSSAPEPQSLRTTIGTSTSEHIPQSSDLSGYGNMALNVQEVSSGDAGGLMSIEDFETQHPYVPPLTKNGLARRTADPLHLEFNDGSQTHTMHAACQSRGLSLKIETPEVAKGCFKAILMIGNQTVEQLIDVYASKRDAKEEVCRRALPAVQAMENHRRTSLGSSNVALRLEHNDGSNSSELHMTCQERGLSPRFMFPETDKSRFGAVLIIDDQIVEQLTEVYSSKRDAKEEVCRRALPAVLRLENRKKRKSSELSHDDAIPDGLGDEEWMGILQDYVQKRKLQRPVIKTEGVHITNGPFYSTIRLQDDPPALFGKEAGPFKSKKIAERVAAMEAVTWLRSVGRLNSAAHFHNPGHESKRRKSTTGGAQALPPGDIQASPSGLNTTSQDQGDESVGKQVHILATSLGFQTPTIRYLQVSGAFVDTFAEFSETDARLEPRLSGEVGKVERVFGKKAAKEMCWRNVLKILDEIRESRLRDSLRLLS